MADPKAKEKDRALQSEASTAQQLRQAGQAGDEELPGSQPATGCIFEVDILLALPGLALEFSPSVGDFKVRKHTGSSICLLKLLSCCRVQVAQPGQAAAHMQPALSCRLHHWPVLSCLHQQCTQLCCSTSLRAASMTLTAAAYELAHLPEAAAAAAAGTQPGLTCTLQHAMEVLLASWMEELANLKRLWDMDEITSLITTDGDQLERPTPLADLMDTDDHRNLVAALQQALMHAFAEAEEFKQVQHLLDLHRSQHCSMRITAARARTVAVYL